MNKKYTNLSRRGFLRLLTMVGAAMGLAGCGSSNSGNENIGSTNSSGDATGSGGNGPPVGNANFLSALRDFGPDWQTFWCCDLDKKGGTVGVLIDGNNHTAGDWAGAENDYTGLVTVSGLRKGVHSYRMTLDGKPGASEYSFRTGPEPGEDFDILYVGDANLKVNEAFQELLAKEPQAAFLFATEAYYLDVQTQYGGPLYTDVNYLSATETNYVSYFKTLMGDGLSRGFRQKYRTATLEEPNRHLAMNTWPMLNMPHNHDFGASDPPIKPGTVRYDAAHKAVFEYASNGNPTTGDSDIDQEPDPVLYFNKRVGDVEIISPDMLSYSGPLADGDLLGSNGNGAGNDKQIVWLQRRIQESQARFILLFLQKPIRGPEWYDPVSGVLQTIQASSKTIVAITADLHNSYAQLIRYTIPLRPMIEIGASSFSAVTSSSGFYIPEQNLVYFSNAHNQTTLKQDYTGGMALLLDSTEGMRAKRKLAVYMNNKFTQTVEIVSIDSVDTVSIKQELASPANAGNVVTYYDWSDATDVEISPATTRCCYAKVLVRPSGTQTYPSSHIELQIKQTFADKIIWRAIINENGRVPIEVAYTP